MRKKRKEIAKERGNGKREMGNIKREREDYSGHKRREIRSTGEQRNIETYKQENRRTKKERNR